MKMFCFLQYALRKNRSSNQQFEQVIMMKFVLHVHKESRYFFRTLCKSMMTRVIYYEEQMRLDRMFIYSFEIRFITIKAYIFITSTTKIGIMVEHLMFYV